MKENKCCSKNKELSLYFMQIGSLFLYYSIKKSNKTKIDQILEKKRY